MKETLVSMGIVIWAQWRVREELLEMSEKKRVGERESEIKRVQTY